MAAARTLRLAATVEPALIAQAEWRGAKAARDEAPIAQAERRGAKARDAAPIAQAEWRDAKARDAAPIARAVLLDVRRAASQAPTSAAEIAGQPGAKAPWEAPTSKALTVAIPLGVRRRAPQDVRPKAASDAHRPGVKHSG